MSKPFNDYDCHSSVKPFSSKLMDELRKSPSRSVYKHIENTREETRKRVKQLLLTEFNYTDDNNPFGDPELSKPFVWRAKIEKLALRGLNAQTDCESLLIKLKNAKQEIEKIRIKKLKREEQKILQRNLNTDIEDKDKSLYEEWKKKDEKFHLAQEKLRMEIRIKAGNERPIDFLHKVIMIWKGFFSVPSKYSDIEQYRKPQMIFDLLLPKEIEEVHEDILTQLSIERERLVNKSFVCFYLDIEKNFKQKHDLSSQDLEDFIDYWSALLLMCDWHLNPSKQFKYLNKEIQDQVLSIIVDKDFNELFEMETQVSKMLEENNSGDNEYWEVVLYNLKLKRSEIILTRLEQKVSIPAAVQKAELPLSGNNSDIKEFLWVQGPDIISNASSKEIVISREDDLKQIKENRAKTLNRIIDQELKLLEKLTPKNEISESELIGSGGYNTIAEVKSIAQQKTKDGLAESSDDEVNEFLCKKTKKNEPNKGYKAYQDLAVAGINNMNLIKDKRYYLIDDVCMEDNLTKQMRLIESEEFGEGELLFNDIISNANTNYIWSSKYKPRKPKYYNRLKTGYEWNKYYQKHYDFENPPPKVIQGYKFNIFYPDLIDKTITPQYVIERSDIKDTCIIRFSAGPPYEDISFKIVNREWDMNEKAGFRNFFDRGILYLYFNFKRYRYKR